MNDKILASFKVGEKHAAGWYVSADWLETRGREGRRRVMVGPFLTEAHAVAYRTLNTPLEPAFRCGGTSELDAGLVNYLVHYAGEERGVEEVRCLLPTECRLVQKGWHGAHTVARIAWLIEEAEKDLGC